MPIATRVCVSKKHGHVISRICGKSGWTVKVSAFLRFRLRRPDVHCGQHPIEVGQMGKSYTDAASNDRKVVSSLEMAVKAFKGKPQGFNGPLGFAFFEWLDDADQTLCSVEMALHRKSRCR